MDEMFKLIVDNGLGIGSFIALIYFIFKYVNNLSAVMEKISNTLTQVQITLATLTDRVDKIEEKINKEKEN